MNPDRPFLLKSARYIKDYKIYVTFNDGKCGIIDFENCGYSLSGSFEPLRDVEYFKDFTIHPEYRVFIWKNGVILCPHTAYKITKDVTEYSKNINPASYRERLNTSIRRVYESLRRWYSKI